MIFGPLGRHALGQVPRGVVVVPPAPPAGGADAFAGGSEWDDRFTRRLPRPKEELEDEDGLILAYWYARENYML
jgi:hypothetical protein